MPKTAGVQAQHCVGTIHVGIEGLMNFESRHIGPDATDRSDIARLLGYESNSALVAAVVPTEILQTEQLALPPAVSETVVL